jgi:hypothetical protein
MSYIITLKDNGAMPDTIKSELKNPDNTMVIGYQHMKKLGSAHDGVVDYDVKVQMLDESKWFACHTEDSTKVTNRIVYDILCARKGSSKDKEYVRKHQEEIHKLVSNALVTGTWQGKSITFHFHKANGEVMDTSIDKEASKLMYKRLVSHYEH